MRNRGTHRRGVSRTVVPSRQPRENHVNQPPHAKLDRPILSTWRADRRRRPSEAGP